MTIQDLELVKTEIEILKIGQHPNIIRLYDTFESYNVIYISSESFNHSNGILCRRRSIFLS
jgi:serine/threonine protein kinase